MRDDCQRQQVPKGVRLARLPRSTGFMIKCLSVFMAEGLFLIRSLTLRRYKILKEETSWQKSN